MTDFGAMLLECHEGALNSGRDHFLHPFFAFRLRPYANRPLSNRRLGRFLFENLCFINKNEKY